MPQLSVIIIGRNEAARIEQCLRSVFDALEGRDDYEVIYVDSASEDATVHIASMFPIRILQLQRNWRLTPSAGRYIGYQHAAGKYLAFVDGDTVMHASWLAESCAFLRDNPAYGGVAGVMEKKCASEDGQSAILVKKRRPQPETAQDVGSLGGIATYCREAMEKAGTFNPYLPTGEECEVALRIRRAGYKLARIQTPMCVTYTLPPESVREIMRRSRAHLYDYGTTLRYCLRNGFGVRFSIEQMWFIYTFAGAGLALFGLLAVALLTGTTWLLIAALAAAVVYLAVKRKHPKYLAISTLKRAMMTYRTLLSFMSTKPLPVESYPRDVVVVK
jgi:glycosyltransferase involved in cell wall biosynthesis